MENGPYGGRCILDENLIEGVQRNIRSNSVMGILLVTFKIIM